MPPTADGTHGSGEMIEAASRRLPRATNAESATAAVAPTGKGHIMASFNRVMLMGNVTRDPQLKYLPSQTPVAEFGLAVDRKFKTAQGEEREEVAVVEITAFGKQAEGIHQYCAKGKPLFVVGRLKVDQWD